MLAGSLHKAASWGVKRDKFMRLAEVNLSKGEFWIQTKSNL